MAQKKVEIRFLQLNRGKKFQALPSDHTLDRR